MILDNLSDGLDASVQSGRARGKPDWAHEDRNRDGQGKQEKRETPPGRRPR